MLMLMLDIIDKLGQQLAELGFASSVESLDAFFSDFLSSAMAIALSRIGKASSVSVVPLFQTIGLISPETTSIKTGCSMPVFLIVRLEEISGKAFPG